MKRPITIFYVYAKVDEDEVLRQQLVKHLVLLRRQRVIAGWEPILAGAPWAEKMEQVFDKAELILLLVSADFLDSDVCYEQHMRRALERERQREVQVIPVLLRPVAWESAPFAYLPVLPKNKIPITSWSNPEEAFKEVAEEIRRVIGPTWMEPLSRNPSFTRYEEAQAMSWLEGSSQMQIAPSTPSLPIAPPFRPPVHLSNRRPWKNIFVVCCLLFILFVCIASVVWPTISTHITYAQATTTAQETADRVGTVTAIARQKATMIASTSAYERYAATVGIMFGFDTQHANANPYEHELNSATVSQLTNKWTFSVSDSKPLGSFIPPHLNINSSPAVVNGVVYVGLKDNNLYAIDAATGKKKWSFPTGNYIKSSPAVVNGVVYVSSEDGTFYAIDATTGSQKWNFPIDSQCLSPGVGSGGFKSSPAVVNGVVYIGSENGCLYAVDATTGSQKWNFPTARGIDSSPAVVNGVVYVSSEDHSLYAIDAVAGKKKWSVSTDGYALSSVAVTNGVIYAGSEDGSFYAIDATTGKKKWSVSMDNNIYSSPMVVNGVVYTGSGSELCAISAATGSQKWNVSTNNDIYSSPIVVNGVVYIDSGGYDLNAFSLPE